MSSIFNSFSAFNQNGFTHFIYILTSNWTIFLLFIACVMSMILKLKDEIDNSVCEEQNII